MKTRKLLSLVLALAMSLMAMGITAFADGNVAQIGDTEYATLQEAFGAVKDGETIVLLDNLTQDNGVIFDRSGVSAKLNLNGKTFTVNEGANVNYRAIRIDNGTLEVYNGSIVAVGNGTTSSNGTGCYGAFRIESNGKLVAHDLTLSNARPYGLNVKVLGGEAELTNVTINSSYGGGIEVTEADLGTSSKAGKATLTNCNFTQTGYFDHCSTTLSVSGGSELIVNSGTYTSNNYALYVFSSGGVINVNGGTFSGGKGTDTNNNNKVVTQAIKAAIDTKTYPAYEGGLNISGGSFSGALDITSPAYMNVTGGTFDNNPTAYVAAGYKAVENDGTWTVEAEVVAEAVAKIGNTEYTTLADAIANVKSGETITLLKNTAGNGISVPENSNFTLDFAGYTYDVNSDPLAGSPGTKTQAFQLKQGSNITFKNGTVTSSKAKMLIQNYCNLTLDNMTLDGTQLVGDAPYTLSNNNGNITIKGTTINAKEGGYAFDVYSFSSYTGANVTVESGTFDGNIQIDADPDPNVDTSNLGLTITGGTFTGDFVTEPTLYSDKITITGGTFNFDPSVYKEEIDGEVCEFPSGYIADGYESVEIELDTKWQVGKVETTDLEPATPTSGYTAAYTATKKVVDSNNKAITSSNSITVNLKAVDISEYDPNAAFYKKATDDLKGESFKLDKVVSSVFENLAVDSADILNVEIFIAASEIGEDSNEYTVAPMAAVYDGNEINEVPLGNDALANGASFDITLPLTGDLASAKKVKVTHSSDGYADEVGIYDVQTDGENKYVTVTGVTHFSTFTASQVAANGEVVINKFDSYFDGDYWNLRAISQIAPAGNTVENFGTWFIPSDIADTESNRVTMTYTDLSADNKFRADLMEIPSTEGDSRITVVSFLNLDGVDTLIDTETTTARAHANYTSLAH